MRKFAFFFVGGMVLSSVLIGCGSTDTTTTNNKTTPLASPAPK
jgi:hypothetical protein